MSKLRTAFGAPVPDDNNIMTAGPRGRALLQDLWFLEKLAHFDREVIPESGSRSAPCSWVAVRWVWGERARHSAEA